MANLQEMKRQGGAVATTPAQAVKMRVDVLNKRKEALGAGKSTEIVVEREIRAASIMIMNSKDLQEADPNTIYTALSIAVNSGIGLCNGHGYLVAYNGKCSFVPGWKGLVDLVSRSGRANVWTGVVYEGDKFDYELGANPFLRHKPEGDSDDWKDATHVYAVGRVKGSDYPIIVVWTVKKVIKHLNKFNKVGTRHYALKGDNNMEMYARKVVLLQAIKYLPSSQDLATAVNAEVAAETNREIIIDGDMSYVPDAPTDEQSRPAYEPQDHYQHPAETMDQDAGQPGADDRQLQRAEPATDARLAGFRSRLMNATDIDVLDADADLIKTFDADDQIELKAIYKERRNYLGNPAPVEQRPRRAAQMNLE